jgi:hypothetical protein
LAHLERLYEQRFRLRKVAQGFVEFSLTVESLSEFFRLGPIEIRIDLADTLVKSQRFGILAFSPVHLRKVEQGSGQTCIFGWESFRQLLIGQELSFCVAKMAYFRGLGGCVFRLPPDLKVGLGYCTRPE